MEKFFNNLAAKISRFTGTVLCFFIAVGIVVVWALLGPVFHWSEGHSLAINTATTIITFLLLFIVQHSQNKDTIALHTKVNALIKAIEEADDKYVGIEDLTEKEIEEIREEVKGG